MRPHTVEVKHARSHTMSQRTLRDANGSEPVAKRQKVMTVRDSLAAKRDAVINKIYERCKDNQEALRQQLAEARKEYADQLEARASVGAASESSTPPKPVSFTVTLTATAGPYEGKIFTVTPRAKHTKTHEVKIGRSTTKPFKTKGVSLPNDDEVSTTHAKLKVQDGVVYYEDAGSSNGSWIDSGEGEEEACQGDLHRLETGYVLHVGQTLFAIVVEANY